MSNAKNEKKVLRVALRRLEHWTKGTWAKRETGKCLDKQIGVTEVCIEGAIFGFKNDTKNPACVMARDIVLQIIKEQYKYPNGMPMFKSVPAFNDHPDTTHEMVMEVTKLALIRAETGGLLRETEEECYVPVKKFL